MSAELTAIREAIESGDFDTARDLSDAYVQANPGEFTDYVAIVTNAISEREAIASVVRACETLREAGLVEAQTRAEAFHLHRWAPQDVGGEFQPSVRNEL